MRPDLRRLLARARELGTSPTARRLLDLVDELADVLGLAVELLEALDTAEALEGRSEPWAAVERARDRARDLRRRLQVELVRLGLAKQQGLPGIE